MKKPTDSDMGRIALKMIIQRMVKDGEIPDKQSIKRELPNVAKEIGEPVELLEGFAAEILPEVLRRRYGCISVELVFDDGKDGTHTVTVKSAK